MNVEAEYEQQVEVIRWVNDTLSCAYELPTKNIQLAHTCFDLAIEHHAAICLLCDSQLYGSMFALLRVEFEAVVNGLWLKYVADDEQINKYEKDDLRLGFGSKINMIESRLGVENGALKFIQKRQWDTFCSFTHGGYQSLVRRRNETHTGSINYPIQEIVFALRHAGSFSLFAAVELSSMTGDETVINECLSVFRKYGQRQL
jgi:hypothetical protein